MGLDRLSVLANVFGQSLHNSNVDCDERGIVRYDYGEFGRQYNPVTICQFADGCHANAHDPDYWQAYLDHIEWLRQNVIDVSDSMAAYEFKFPWSFGLRAGWRSGLAQAAAIATLIQYHYHTGDASILPLIRRLKNYMMLPRQEGGVAARTPEGGIWIEEFPSDPPSLVLNGFISAIMSLDDFVKLFPEDEQARKEFEAAIASLKQSLPAYDTGTGSRPHRRAEAAGSSAYQELHFLQLRKLATITGDQFFGDVALRWQSFFTDVHVNLHGNMSADPAGVFRVQASRPLLLPSDGLRNNYEVVDATPLEGAYGIEHLFDNDNTTYIAPLATGTSRLHFRLLAPVEADTLALQLYNPALYPKTIEIEIKEVGQQGLWPVNHERASDRQWLAYYFRPAAVEEIRITSCDHIGQDRLVLSEIRLGKTSPKPATLPQYGSHLTAIYRMAGPTFQASVCPLGEGRVFVMYRCADKVEDVENQQWAFDFVDPKSPDQRPVKAAYYQFKVVVSQDVAGKGWRDFRVQGAHVLGSVPGQGWP